MDSTGLLWQDVMNGKAVGNTTAAAASENGTAKTESSMDETKEMFLKLLVAEMQYQDPLQPTDNSEYVKELSQFTQVETLNSVNDQVEQLSAHTLVGKYVDITDSESGKQVEGKVDFVSNNNGIMYVSVDGALYKVSDVKSVSESNYFENTTMAANVEQLINLLPAPERLTLSDANRVADVAASLSALSPEAFAMVSQEAKQRLSDIVTKMDQLKAKQAEIDKDKQETTGASGSNKKPEEVSAEDSKDTHDATNSGETVTDEENNPTENAEKADNTNDTLNSKDGGNTEDGHKQDALEDIPTTIVE